MATIPARDNSLGAQVRKALGVESSFKLTEVCDVTSRLSHVLQLNTAVDP